MAQFSFDDANTAPAIPAAVDRQRVVILGKLATANLTMSDNNLGHLGSLHLNGQGMATDPVLQRKAGPLTKNRMHDCH